jgi:protein-tyrosine-phosphatase
MDRKFKILFLCTGNSARSILAEFLMRRIDPVRFEAFSAGAQPSGRLNPFAIRYLEEECKIDTTGARSKSWEEFKDTAFDFVITVCDHARESCPVWPGQPIIAHWGSPDPAEMTGSDDEIYQQVRSVGMQIRRRLELFTSLPLEKLETLKLAEMVRDIGRQAS